MIAAFEGGARGVILSRKYSEMRLANLFAVKEALQAVARVARPAQGGSTPAGQ